MSLARMNERALAEIGACIGAIDETSLVRLMDVLASSKRIAIYGCGREGLMMRALCMRLFHLGLDVHMVGDMTTPPVSEDDLLFVSAGPGYLETVEALITVAKKAGAKIAAITAEPGSAVTRRADAVLVIPAQTMARDQSEPTSFLPMGSLFEASMLLFFEFLVMRLKERLGETSDSMRARHTNLE